MSAQSSLNRIDKKQRAVRLCQPASLVVKFSGNTRTRAPFSLYWLHRHHLDEESLIVGAGENRSQSVDIVLLDGEDVVAISE